ncbi:uncharacterized protein rab11fip5a isoform X2 [Sebastes umbrosus]|uniref:uncharacterized protein rab11fip5a isoform X2 n=1 Tax=Sebastes umbrosus TaxID=72105 RepID=UPI0018A0226F|nr:uncharacterized protein rab11fip5a isoform X2 [Sebastes umbrosus]
MSSLTVEEDQKWLPTHVQVTVLRGRGLRGKGKHGTSDVYTIIQLGKEKYSTGVVEKTTEPEWREECSFELQPGVLLENNGLSSSCPAGSNELVLIVMHRGHMVMDVFLGQAVVQLDKVFHETRYVRNQWYKLNSKTGKKEKERGDIQVTIQFTRNNLTASMYDLVMKDKGASTFGKLKERIKGKKRSSEEDLAAAVLPSGYGSLQRMRTRLPSDGGGEEDYEDDEGGEARRSKMRTFFLRGKLRKSSDTRSCTSLGSESSESSSRGGSLSPTAGISVVVSDLSNSPSNSSNLTVDNSPEHTDNMSPKSSSLICEFGDEPDDEPGEITIAVPQFTVCVNGSHAYNVQPLDPGSGKPADSLGLGPLQKSLPLSVSLQNLRPSANLPKSPVGDGRRWSFDKPGEEEKAAIAAALEKSGPMLGDEEEQLGRAASSSSSTTAESESQGKKQRRNLFSSGRSESAGKGQSQSKDESEQALAATEEKHKGWFGSKDSHSKPSARPPIAQLFPQASNPTLTHDNPTTEDSIIGTDAKSEVMAKAEKRPLPPTPMEGESPLSGKLSNPFMCAGELDLDSEWDESFEAFAAGRLQSPEDLTTDCKTQQNSEHPLEHCSDKGALLPVTDQNTNVNQPCTDFVFDAHKTITNAYHLDTFAQFLETIPEHASFESDNMTLNTSTNSPKLDVRSETNRATNTNDLTDTNMHQAPRHASPVKLNSSSPDPGSSGLGSSAEEDFLSCLSSYSDKFSASSSKEAEAQIFEINVLGFEKSADSSVVKNVKHSESEDDVTDGSTDLSLVDVAQHTVIQQSNGDEKADLNGLEGSQQSPVLTHQQPVIAARETGSEGANTPSPNFSNTDLLPERSNISLQPDTENEEKGTGEFNESEEDFSKVLNDSSVFVRNTTDDDKLCSTRPSLHIITSSPDVKQSSSDSPIESTSLGGQNVSDCSPIPFGLFGDLLNTSRITSSPSRDFDDALLHSRVSDQSSSSFFQSLYVSADSQDYQTCESHPSSKCSEPNKTLHSATSTLCGELSEIQTTADDALGQDVSTNACKPNNEDKSEGSVCGAEDKTATLESNSMIGYNFDLLPTDSYMSSNQKELTEGGVESQHTILGDVLSKSPQAQSAALYRSQSEGTLILAFDELLLPSFGSDPGAIQESSSSAQPGPDLPSLTSFAPSLTPQSSSSPLALCSLPPLANATARSPPSTPRAAAPMLLDTQQQQAANQQNSPHPVKPLTTAIPAEEKRTEGRSVLATGLEKLKSTIHPGRSSQLSEQDTDRKKVVTEGAGSYYHLNHSELVALLVQRESELERQKLEYDRQKSLLAKREVELKKLKPQVKDLEDYIDTLLVRIMEQKPTLLQVRSKLK